MVEEAKRTLAYLCPACRQSVAVERSVFQLAASANELPCPCGKSSLRVELMGDRVKLTVPCLFCGKDHTVTCSSHAFLHEKVLAFSCAASGLDCCYVGEEGPVYAATARLERAVDKMIGNAAAGGYYDENVNIWENDIQGLCSLIQDYITQYNYYEMINMEQLQKELKVQMADQMQSYLALLLVVLVVGMFLAVTITKSITEPLQQLQRTAEQLGRGNLNARARTGGLEEINVLARAFNQMSDRIRRLLDKTRQEQKNLRELELRLHQEQISPHFLYNTLDSIVWMAEGGNNRQVVEMTTDLSDFFRTVLSGGRDFITIEEEESHIRSYLKIQKIRYEDILDYSIEIEPSIRRRIVLKMLLQPLVENALYHGIKNKRGGGCIVIRGYEDQNGLVFEVEDDGIGMDEAELAAVRAKLTLEPEEELAPIGSGGFGLHNVVQRIQMYYGDQAEILVESEKNIGTCFKVYLGNQKKS